MTESNRNSLMQAGDAIRRSLTRNSHYSHASTHSWVISNQQNPPPPPPEDPLPSTVAAPRPFPGPNPSPVRTSRPLPDPQLQAQHHRHLRTTNGELTVVTRDDDTEYMNIDPNIPGLETGYLTEGLGRGRQAEFPTAADVGPGRERGFVGGFVSGLRRLPRVVLKYRSFGEKRKYFRRATYGTSGGTLTNGTITNATETGNTLPVYVSNPPTPIAGPSRYVEALEMPVPHPADLEAPAPDILGPSLSQRRRHPSFRVSPPSEEATGQEGTTELSVDPVQPTPPIPGTPGRISTAVTVYDLSDHEYRPEEPTLPLPESTPNRLSNSQSQNVRSPSASIPAEAQSQSPVLAHPLPTPDYRKMTFSSSPRSRGTVSTLLSSEPSFSSQLNPVKSFLVKLYRLPWIASDRVTTDYRPGGRDRRHRVGNGPKKPMSSWYRGKPGVVLSVKDGSGELDLLSSNSGSRRASTGTSSTPLSSPALHVRHRSSDHQRTHHREHRSHHTRDGENSSRSHGRSHHRRNTMPSKIDIQPQSSPMIPAVYPYPYPFPIPYPTFPPPPPPPQRVQSQSTPRGPRPHRTPVHPHGYAPYQPPQPPPPVFVVHSPVQTASSVEGLHAPTQAPMYLPMPLIPGVFPPESTQPAVSSPAPTFLPVSPPTGEAVPAQSA